MAKRESQRDINCHSCIYTVSREYIICGARWYDSYLVGTVRMEYCVVCGELLGRLSIYMYAHEKYCIILDGLSRVSSMM